MRAILLGIASLGLVVRALVPSGYMAAPVSEGWPVTLCPSQASEFFPGWDADRAGHHGGSASHEGAGQHGSSHHGSSHHADVDGEVPPSESPSEESTCPLGAYINAAIDLDSESSAVVFVEVGRAHARSLSIGYVAARTFAFPRGPPVPLPLEALET